MQFDDDTKWYHLSICQGMNLNWFYDEYESDPVLAKNMDNICLSCPVRSACLREGIENKEYGLWGGVFLSAGRADRTRNAHKGDDIWSVIREGIAG